MTISISIVSFTWDNGWGKAVGAVGATVRTFVNQEYDVGANAIGAAWALWD